MNLHDLLTMKITKVDIDEIYNIDKEYYKDTEILELKDIKVNGSITYPADDNLLLDIKVNGIMVIPDSVTLDAVDYNFSIEISENVYEKLENDQFTLDIIEILWENIVLEIPIRFSIVDDYTNLAGDGWKVISEDDIEKDANNPFKDLLKQIEEE